MEPNDQKTDYFDKVMAWAQKDALIIVVCMFALGACLYTLMSVEGYQVAINQAWMQQWDMSGCKAGYKPVNISWNVGGNYDDVKDSGIDTQGVRPIYR